MKKGLPGGEALFHLGARVVEENLA
jgi:hypothetical protein